MAAQDIEEDEMYLTVELSGVMGRDWLKPDLLEQFKVIGIDSEKPILQLGQYIFVGEFEDIVGTSLFFEQTKDEEGEKSVQYVGKTMKKLKMVRAFITDNETDDSLKHDASGVNVQGHHTSVIDFKQFKINDDKNNDDKNNKNNDDKKNDDKTNDDNKKNDDEKNDDDVENATEEKRRKVETKKSTKTKRQYDDVTSADSVKTTENSGKISKHSVESSKEVSEESDMDTSKSIFTSIKGKETD